MYFYALYYYRKAVKLRPRDARMWCALANCCAKLDRSDEAIRAYERAATAGDQVWLRSPALPTRETTAEILHNHLETTADARLQNHQHSWHRPYLLSRSACAYRFGVFVCASVTAVVLRRSLGLQEGIAKLELARLYVARADKAHPGGLCSSSVSSSVSSGLGAAAAAASGPAAAALASRRKAAQNYLAHLEVRPVPRRR